MLILNKQEVTELLTMPACIALMEDALASLARGEVILPLRPVIRIPDSPNAFAVMPAYSAALAASAAKLITVYPGNHGTGLDSHQGVVALFDGADGRVLAIIDAASITAIRTAAVSGVATRLLARDDATTLTVLGSGTQARSHIDAMMAVRPFERVTVWGRTTEHARTLVAEARGRHDAAFHVATDPAAAVMGADVVCTVTASREPVLLRDWLRPGSHVNAVGASLPSARELDSEAVRRATVFVDRRESAATESGDLMIPRQEGVIDEHHIAAEIGEVITGAKAGRREASEVTLFKSLGLAVEDLACAQYLHAAAERDQAGTWVEL